MKWLKYIIRRKHFVITVLSCAIIALLSLFTFNISFMNPIANAIKNMSMTDVFFKIENSTSVPDTCHLITIVDVTELTSRGEIGEVLLSIYEMNPVVIGVDLIFEGEKDDIEGNLILENAVDQISPKTIFANKLIDFDVQKGVFTNSVSSYFHEAFSLSEGYANVTDDMEKATVRTFTICQTENKEQRYSLPAQLAKRMGARIDGLTGEMTINYSPTLFPVVSYKDINTSKHLLENHIVIVGVMEEQDMHLSPLGKTPGIEIQAYSTLTLLRQKNVKIVSIVICCIIGFVLCYIFELLLDITSIWFEGRKSQFAIFIREAEIPLQVVSFLFLIIVTLCSFVLFVNKGIYIDTILILALLIFVIESRNLYNAFMKAFISKDTDNTKSI